MRRQHNRIDDVTRAWTAACNDARNLAIELAAGRPQWPIDAMQLGLVIDPGETAFRYVGAILSQFDSRSGSWPYPLQVSVLITDRRLLIRLPLGATLSLWWNAVVAMDIKLEAGQVVLDFGDGEPRQIAGISTPAIAVAATAAIYGVDALLRHQDITGLHRRYSN